jgi:hypothetical protein
MRESKNQEGGMDLFMNVSDMPIASLITWNAARMLWGLDSSQWDGKPRKQRPSWDVTTFGPWEIITSQLTTDGQSSEIGSRQQSPQST